jgi:hypothetical protein
MSISKPPRTVKGGAKGKAKAKAEAEGKGKAGGKAKAKAGGKAESRGCYEAKRCVQKQGQIYSRKAFCKSASASKSIGRNASSTAAVS